MYDNEVNYKEEIYYLPLTCTTNLAIEAKVSTIPSYDLLTY